MTALSYKRPRGLTVAQQNAVDLLVTGLNDRAAAERLGLSRETVTRWRNYDPAFQATLNERRAALWTCAADGIRAAVPLALETVREQLDIGPRRDRLALDLLTRIGLLGTRSGTARAAAGSGPSPFDPLGVGPTTIGDLLDAEVRRLRAAAAAQHGPDNPFHPPVGAPITDDDREAAYLHLQALAAQYPDDEDNPYPATPPPTDHT